MILTIMEVQIMKVFDKCLVAALGLSAGISAVCIVIMIWRLIWSVL